MTSSSETKSLLSLRNKMDAQAEAKPPQVHNAAKDGSKPV